MDILAQLSALERQGDDYIWRTAKSAREEIAKLREQLAEAQASAVSMTNEAIHHKQRAEAAEAKLKAASEQEPCGYVNENGTFSLFVPGDFIYSWKPVYAAQIPPVDAKECYTCKEREQLGQPATGIYQIEQEKLIAELERKLAERQASEVSIVVAAWRHGASFLTTGPDMEAVDAVLQNIGSGTKELNALIAQAREEGRKAGEEIATHERVAILRNGREEGRKEAVPDVDWLSNVIRSVDKKHDLGAGTLAEKIVEAIRNNTGDK